ncbi:type II toxin-antitoxin system PemK/MazF family toxin [Acinetobacter pittii]|uniref:type II toxin-antitoxin system PemK/MazF family toxin n=1 Tax=Acinetobacter pittii TaxID=48296 RepID=UPI002AFF4203|nr:type II toxin-antitoxin system PemK/MazF family toxin [Acinetobacter pittii]
MSRLEDSLNRLKQKIENNLDSKRVNLICDWLDTWGMYIDQESTFDPQKRRNYKAGDIVSICLGYNVGSEQGGNRPAVVLGRSSRTSKSILVVPLGSLANDDDETKLRSFEVLLGPIEEFNQETKRPLETRSKALINQLRPISKQRIINPTTSRHNCINIGEEKLQLIEEAIMKSIVTTKNL